MGDEDKYEEVKKVLEEENYQDRAKILYNEKKDQYSVKIPRRIARKVKLDPEKEEFLFEFIQIQDKKGDLVLGLKIKLVPKNVWSKNKEKGLF